MFNLLKLELHKLFKQPSFYICNLIIILISLISYIINITLVQSDISLDFNNILINHLSNNNLLLISGIFIALYSTKDYNEDTLKNIYSRGYSRNKAYLAKFLIILIFIFISFILSLLFTYILNNNLNINKEINNKLFINLIIELIIYISYASFYYLISNILKKSGSSIAGIIITPLLISLIFSMLDNVFKIENFSFNILWLDNSLNSLNDFNNHNLIINLISAIFYLIIFNIIGLIINKKIEI